MIPYYLISDDREEARMVVDACNNQTAARIMCVRKHAGMLAEDPEGKAERA